MSFFSQKTAVFKLLKIVSFSFFVPVMIVACGGQRGDQIPDSTTSRSMTPVDKYSSWEDAMEVCREARRNSEDKPLSHYVSALHQLADEQQEVCAMYGLGMLYLQGYEAFAADPALARNYLLQASAHGVAAADRLLQLHTP